MKARPGVGLTHSVCHASERIWPGRHVVEAEGVVRSVAAEAAASLGLELWDVEIRGGAGKRDVTVYADKAGGVTLGELEALSRALEGRRELGAALPGSFRLDVASPGPERRLRGPDDVRRFEGQRAQFRLTEGEGTRRRLTGLIRGMEDGILTVDGDDGHTHRIAWSDIALARLRP